jgi:hypothetical protein
MTENGFEQFASDYRSLGRDPDDVAIDRLLRARFALDLELAPDIIRSAVRRAVKEAQPPSVVWEALHAVHRDVVTLPPLDRIPAPRPLARQPSLVGR